MRKFLFFLSLLSLSFGGGRELYLKHCAGCHGEDRLGRTAPPLFSLPPFFSLSPDEKIYQIVKRGAVGMPPFAHLREEEIKAIVEFIKQPVEKVSWEEERIKGSVELLQVDKVDVKRPSEYTLVVERGAQRVWVMEGEELLGKFPFSNIHGGIKFSKKAEKAYIPSRDGWVGLYSYKDGTLKRVRACIYLRNIALSRDDQVLAVSCWLPPSLVFFDGELQLKKVEKVEGRVNAIYEFKDGFVFTFRDSPLMGLVSKSLKIDYKRLDAKLEDFIIDPLEKYLIGSTKDSLRVYELGDNPKLVKEFKTAGLPHLASAYFWYSGGDFYFATPQLGKRQLSLWKAYRWEHIKDIPLDGEGFLARSNYKTPYVWIDNSTDTLTLLHKRTFELKKLTPSHGKRATHTEFNGDGSLAYVSVYEKEGSLVVYDAITLKKLKEYPASLPAGKYNFINKNRALEGALLGYQVFMEKCWGCHHTTEKAFGPPLKWSAQNREKALLMAQILDPENTYRLLNYERNAMPKIKLSEEELSALMKFLEALKDGWMD
jgi:mono/diheme cytochrome c family protein